mmetsp:Transcript_69280/g.206283  ORF Transcript_69280/g.206283 Transcript_69280/m.206283 type:complete len:222 (-) Transcript_69280:7-672(-)
MVRSRRRASCSGVPLWSRTGTRLPSSYLSSPIVGITSTSVLLSSTSVKWAFAVSSILFLDSSERIVAIFTLVMPRAGTAAAKAGICSRSPLTVTSSAQPQRQMDKSRSSGVLPRRRSRTYPPLTKTGTSCSPCSWRNSRRKRRMRSSWAGIRLAYVLGRTSPCAAPTATPLGGSAALGCPGSSSMADVPEHAHSLTAQTVHTVSNTALAADFHRPATAAKG